MTTDTLEDRAAELGREAGENAASWFFDGNSEMITAENIIVMAAEGDPALWDMLPTVDLSGEWADGPTPTTLAEDIDLCADGYHLWADYVQHGRTTGTPSRPCVHCDVITLDVGADDVDRATDKYHAVLDELCTAWETAATEAIERIVVRDAYRMVMPDVLEQTATARREADANWRQAILEAATKADMSQSVIGTYAGVSQQRIGQILDRK